MPAKSAYKREFNANQLAAVCDALDAIEEVDKGDASDDDANRAVKTNSTPWKCGKRRKSLAWSRLILDLSSMLDVGHARLHMMLGIACSKNVMSLLPQILICEW